VGELVAAAVEEACKIAVVYWIVWRRPEFDERMDGIVYASRAGLGFALVENVLYLLGQTSLTGQLYVWVARALLAVPGHAMWTGMIGAMAARLVGDRRLELVGCWTFVAIVVLGYGPWFFATRYLAYPGHCAIFLVLPIIVASIVEVVRTDGAARRVALGVAASGTVVIGVLHGNYVLYPALFAVWRGRDLPADPA
jgi:RsiW-degrading membrane proteinase PrsW (M82 family)